MKLVDIPLERLSEAPWNPNTMTPEMVDKLKQSIIRFEVVENMVVRPIGDSYEVIGGNQRLRAYRELGMKSAPCVVVDLDDGQARLLAQVLNRTRGEDDLALKALLVQEVLEVLPVEELVALLPDTGPSLEAVGSIGQESIAEALQKWQQAQQARLHHLTFQLTDAQIEVVEKALETFMTMATKEHGSSNRRGIALYHLCLDHLKRVPHEGKPTPSKEES